MHIVDSISSLFLFRSVPERNLQELCILAPPILFPAGATIFEQGAKADVGFLLITGQLDVFVQGNTGERRMVGEIRAGEVLGEQALFSKACIRTASVTAVKDSQCLLLSDDLFQRGSENPAIIAIEQHLLGTLARRIRRTNQAIQKEWRAEDIAQAGTRELSFGQRLRSLFGSGR